MSFILSLLFVCIFFAFERAICRDCTSILFTDLGDLDIDSMLKNCSTSAAGISYPPSYYGRRNNSSGNYTFNATEVQVQFAMNRLISVDDVKSEFELDFFLRLMWYDDRLILPDEMWSYVNPEIEIEGIELSQVISSLDLWKPDVYFYETTESDTVDELIRLATNGRMYWSRHMIMTFANPQMAFQQFPNDRQDFTITMESFAYDNRVIRLSFINGQSVVLNTDVSGSVLIENNELWEYITHNSKIITTLAPSPLNPDRKYSTSVVSLTFQRLNDGIILRLVLPILSFMIIAGFAYWSNDAHRLDVSLRMILVVSAMYISIGKSIPAVGYLTLIDVAIITVFAALAIYVCFHFMTLLLPETMDRYPMDIMIKEGVLLIFRVAWLPLSTWVFMHLFNQYDSAHWIALLTFFCATSVVYVLFNIHILRKTMHIAFMRLLIKHELVYRYHAKDLKSHHEGNLMALKPTERFAIFIVDLWLYCWALMFHKGKKVEWGKTSDAIDGERRTFAWFAKLRPDKMEHITTPLNMKMTVDMNDRNAPPKFHQSTESDVGFDSTGNSRVVVKVDFVDPKPSDGKKSDSKPVPAPATAPSVPAGAAGNGAAEIAMNDVDILPDAAPTTKLKSSISCIDDNADLKFAYRVYKQVLMMKMRFEIDDEAKLEAFLSDITHIANSSSILHAEGLHEHHSEHHHAREHANNKKVHPGDAEAGTGEKH